MRNRNGVTVSRSRHRMVAARRADPASAGSLLRSTVCARSTCENSAGRRLRFRMAPAAEPSPGIAAGARRWRRAGDWQTLRRFGGQSGGRGGHTVSRGALATVLVAEWKGKLSAGAGGWKFVWPRPQGSRSGPPAGWNRINPTPAQNQRLARELPETRRKRKKFAAEPTRSREEEQTQNPREQRERR